MPALLLVGSLCSVGTIAAAEDTPAVPPPALAAGYTLHTASTAQQFSPATVDVGLTYAPGFQWYFWNFWGTAPTASNTVLNADGSIATQGSGGSLVSAAKLPHSPYFVGTAYGGGGYFEAEISFDPATTDVSHGWPAWWTMSAEHLVGLNQQRWAGQPDNYHHFIEVDTFEYDMGAAAYGAAVHEWYGVWNDTCGGRAYCSVSSPLRTTKVPTPADNDWRHDHRLGMLWVPATASAKGKIAFYFDDALMSSYDYQQFAGEPPPPTSSTPWKFGIIDQQHLILIFGSGDTPITVRAVNVWQKTTSNNWVNQTSE